MANTTKYPGLKEAIVFNETKLDTPDYKSAGDLAKEFGCSLGYIYRQRYLLGIANMPEKQPTPTIRLTDAISDTGALKDLLAEPLISPLDRLKVLSRLIRTGAPQVKIAAIKAYEELTRTSEGRIGPGTPLTDDEKATRLARLLMAVGETVAKTAWETAFGNKTPTSANRAPLPAPTPVIPEPKTPLQESLHDLPLKTPAPPSPRD